MRVTDFPLSGLIGGGIAAVLGAAGTAIFHLSILPAVNKNLPLDERVPFYATNTRVFFIFRKHEELYPSSKLRTMFFLLFGFAFASVLIPVLFIWIQALVTNWLSAPK